MKGLRVPRLQLVILYSYSSAAFVGYAHQSGAVIDTSNLYIHIRHSLRESVEVLHVVPSLLLVIACTQPLFKHYNDLDCTMNVVLHDFIL
jgi:hypothetical protein